MLCARGWHVRCCPASATVVSKKFVLCCQHSQERQMEGPAAQQHGQQAGALPQQQPQLEQDAQLPPAKKARRPHVAAGQAPSVPTPAALTPMAAAELQQLQPPAEQPLHAGQVRIEQQQQQQQQQDSEDGELCQDCAPPAAGQLRLQQAAPGSSQQPLCGSNRAPAQACAAVPAGLQQSLSSHSSQTLAPVATGRAPSLPQRQGLSPRQGASLPSPLSHGKQLGKSCRDLDAQGEQPLSPNLSLRPSWQASLAARPALDYGEL